MAILIHLKTKTGIQAKYHSLWEYLFLNSLYFGTRLRGAVGCP